MNDDNELLGLRDYLDMLRRRRRLIGGVIATTVLAAAVASMFTRFTYQSSVELLVQAPSGSGVLTRAVYGDADLRTQQRLITSLDVTERVARDLGMPPEPAELRGLIDRVTVELISDTSVMVISAEHEVPEMAAAIPLAFAENYMEYRQELARSRIESARQQLEQHLDDIGVQLTQVESELGVGPLQERPVEEDTAALEDDELGLLSERDRLLAQLAAVEGELTELALLEEFATGGRVISPVALPEQASVWGVLVRNVVLGALLGAALGVMSAFAREWGEDRVVHERDINAITGRPLIGRVCRSSHDGSRTTYASDSASADAYRALRATAGVAITSARQGGPQTEGETALPFPSILVTDLDGLSCGSEVAANLAVAFARSGTRTLLVDARREPASSAYFATTAGMGLNDVIAGESDARRAIHATGEPRLQVMVPGHAYAAARDSLTAGRFVEVMHPLKGDIDLVVIDAGPGPTAGEVLEMSIVATATIVVAGWQISTRESLRDTVHRLHNAGSEILGTVVVEREPVRGDVGEDSGCSELQTGDGHARSAVDSQRPGAGVASD